MSENNVPGVYINESNSNPFHLVETAIPAFIGYTPQNIYEGKSLLNSPVKIESFTEFLTIFCHPTPKSSTHVVKQYEPHYYLIKEKKPPSQGDFIQLGNEYYSILPDPSTIYYLYNSIKLFYQNGGGSAYIVSTGTYGKPHRKTNKSEAQIVNPNIQLNDLLKGLTSLKKEQEVTMYICPDATLLSVNDNSTLMKAMLLQNSEMQTAISIFDIIGAHAPDPVLYTNDIQTFRNNTGNDHLEYGTAYYPFVETYIMEPNDIDYTNIQGGDISQLEPILNPVNAPNTDAATILATIENPPSNALSVTEYQKQLIKASQFYDAIIKKVLSIVNVLPPSGALAGVMTTTDDQRGVWKAPANVSMSGVISLPIRLNDQQQESLNIDVNSGKSINAIRSFTGRGILIWGARTLAGNHMDWRYISVRRTMIMIEQSCKLATKAYVFEPNHQNTWTKVTSMINSFLTSIWREGGLVGATPEDSFFIRCGLGTTMTTNDILENNMIISVGVALTRPAEFIVFSFTQKMASA